MCVQNVSTENEGDVVRASREMSVDDKSRSVSDLRPTEDEDANQAQQQQQEMGSVERNSAVETFSSDEFIRRSLQRLNLPDWYLHTKLFDPKRSSGEFTPNPKRSNTVSCSPIDVGEREGSGDARQLSPVSPVTSSGMFFYDVYYCIAHFVYILLLYCMRLSYIITRFVFVFVGAATSLVNGKSSSVSSSFDGEISARSRAQLTAEHPTTDRVERLETNESDIRQDGQTSLSPFTREFNVSSPPEKVESRERRRRRRVRTWDETEQQKQQEDCRCPPHGKKTTMKCSHCRQEEHMVATRCCTRSNEPLTDNGSPLESTVKATTASASVVRLLHTYIHTYIYTIV